MKKLLLTLTGVSMIMTALMAQADMEVCAGKPYTLTNAKPAEGAEPITYAWFENSSPIGSGTDELIVAEGRQAGNYTYVRTASNEDCSALSSNVFTVQVRQPGTNGQSAVPCGCVSGTIPCSSTCKTEAYTYTYDGACAGCSIRYVKQWNACGALVTDRHSTKDDVTCWTSGCPPIYDANCTNNVSISFDYNQAECGAAAAAYAMAGGYHYYGSYYMVSQTLCAMYRCN
jgi:hypothetical protein